MENEFTRTDWLFNMDNSELKTYLSEEDELHIDYYNDNRWEFQKRFEKGVSENQYGIRNLESTSELEDYEIKFIKGEIDLQDYFDELTNEFEKESYNYHFNQLHIN